MKQYNPEVKMVWTTPNAEGVIIDCARVSSSKSAGMPDNGLIRYLITHNHWSPFEMSNICLEITGVPRDITRQLLRHGSFHFQEFSQRYADTASLGGLIGRECRMQDPNNRQNSLDATDPALIEWWNATLKCIGAEATNLYTEALGKGIAKEVARAILPEGMTPTRMFVNGTVRDWIHYVRVRRTNDAQAEHQELAQKIADQLYHIIPRISSVAFEDMAD